MVMVHVCMPYMHDGDIYIHMRGVCMCFGFGSPIVALLFYKSDNKGCTPHTPFQLTPIDLWTAQTCVIMIFFNLLLLL